jgi:hypothetical protein
MSPEASCNFVIVYLLQIKPAENENSIVNRFLISLAK